MPYDRKAKEMFGVTTYEEITGAKLPSRGQVIGRMYYRISKNKETVSTSARYNI